MKLAVFVLAAWMCVPLAVAEADPGQAVYDILNRRCGSCHGKTNAQSGLNVLDWRKLTSQREQPAVVPGKPEESELWKRISSTDDDLVMPPGERLPDAEQQLLKTWIVNGAAEFKPSVATRPFIPIRDVYSAVETDLRTQPAEKRPRFRYFTIHHLHNNPTISEADLRFYRAALSKLVNSLSWESSIVIPDAIDKHQTVLRIDLQQIDWQEDRLWNRLLSHYPYGLTYDSSQDEQLAASAAYVYGETRSRIPVIRADWFVAAAAVPPLYHDMLRLPDGPGADKALERMLRVDVEFDFLNDRLRRAGFVKSNVSEHNRLVDRHSSTYGAYWKSYDFASTTGRHELVRFPLGPDFPDNPFSRVAFQQDGGELIFNLPNGLQGYLLIDGQGKRIDKGPINVVFDSKQPLGNKEVINGISCMVCHARGMQPFNDDILAGHTLRGEEARKVRDLYPRNEDFAKLVEMDSQRFLRAQQQATSAFLTAEDDLIKREPVGAIAKQYSQDLYLADVSAELGHADSEALRALLLSPLLRQVGLAPVAQDKVIKRRTWESLSPQQPYSLYHDVADALELGTPERVFP